LICNCDRGTNRKVGKEKGGRKEEKDASLWSSDIAGEEKREPAFSYRQRLGQRGKKKRRKRKKGKDTAFSSPGRHRRGL